MPRKLFHLRAIPEDMLYVNIDHIVWIKDGKEPETSLVKMAGEQFAFNIEEPLEDLIKAIELFRNE